MEQLPTLYVLARNDLASMNSGKLAAQTCHCGSAFAKHMEDSKDPLYKKWQNETNQGFGTVLVLEVNEAQMNTAVDVGNALGFVAGVVHDPTYPILVPTELGRAIRKDYGPYAATGGPTVTPGETDNYVTVPEDTCGYLFGEKDDPIVKLLVGNYPLHP